MKKKKINTGDKTVDKLYDAVRDYIEKKGGSVVVFSGIALVQETPNKHNYGLMVRIAGKRPILKQHAHPKR